MDEVQAARIFQVAINQGRAAELLTCLFEGGSATVDPKGDLVLASSDILQQLMDNST